VSVGVREVQEEKERGSARGKRQREKFKKDSGK
jgi:hypothetical protein